MQNEQKNYNFAIIIIGALFFIFGFITWANGTLIPYLKIACELTSNTLAFLVTFAFFIAYGVMAIPSSIILRTTGYKKGMSLGLAIMSIGAALFIPAAFSRSFPLFLIGLFVIATGLTLLQTASNPYVTILGPIESAAKRISIMGVCNKIAGILAGLILGAIVLKDADAIKAKLLTLEPAAKAIELDALAQRVVVPYIIISLSFAALAIILHYIQLPDITQPNESEHHNTSQDRKSITQYPYLILGAIAIFMYVGVEVLSYDTIVSLGDYLKIPLDDAKYFASFTGIFMLIGYFVGIVAIPKYISQERALIACTLLGILLTIAIIIAPGSTPIIALAACGIANSLLWPVIWPLSIAGLGRYTQLGSALLIIGITGGALIPPLYGMLADTTLGSQAAYSIMIPCYLYILWFGISGHKIGKTN
jgi:glucose/galactose transporter